MTESPHAALETAFDRTREELGIPTRFPREVLAEAEGATRRRAETGEGREDRTALPFLTIDPPGSRDLDQALFIERDDAGYRVWYAIADVGFFVDRGSLLEEEAWRRGLTAYAPDERHPLYPEALSQGAASLLPGQRCPSVLFRLELDAEGRLSGGGVERALVESRAQLTYEEAQAGADRGGDGGAEGAETLPLLAEVGRLREEREAERGGVSLRLRSQRVQAHAARRLGYQVVYEEPLPAEGWNAQISLLAGHAAALRMLEAGVGLLRTLAPGTREDLDRFRVAARALGFSWPEGLSYPDFLRAVDPAHSHAEALLWQARRVMRGADYVAFRGEAPRHREHSALAMPYAHCTAPLRRLADRYVLDLLLTLSAGGRPTEAEWETLAALPKAMETAAQRTAKLERRVVDLAEAWSLRKRVGERFTAVVLAGGSEQVEVQIEEPPVRAKGASAKPLETGARVEVRLSGVDLEHGTLELAVV